MPSRRSYNRFFIILQEDQRGYGLDTSKTPSGYAKLETMNDRAKASFYVQNLKRQKGPFNMVLIVEGKNRKELVNLGQINIDDMGKADISNEYSSDNIANTNISMDKVQGAAICRISSDTIVPIMVGFAGGEELNNWSTYPIAAVSDKKEKQYSTPLVKTPKVERKPEVMQKNDKADARTTEKKLRADLNSGTQAETQKCNPEELETLREQLFQIRREKAALEQTNQQLTTDLDKLRLDMENLQNEKNKLDADRLQLNRDIEAFNKEKEAYQSERDNFNRAKQEFENEKAEFNKMKACLMKDKSEFESQKSQYADKNKCSICKYIKVKRTDEAEEDNSDDYLSVRDFNPSDSDGQSFEEYEDEIEQYKNYRDDRGKKHKEHKNKKCMEKCKTYPKEKKEEFFNGVVKGLEKVGKKENIKNCEWYKADVDKLESMYCIYDYNKYAIIFYPMICYYPYIAKSGQFMVGYKYDDDNKLRYIIYAIPGSKELRDQPYEGKTGFVTFMPDDYDNNNGYWLMYYDIDENTVVVPVKRG